MELLPVLGLNRMYFYLSKLKYFKFPITSAEKCLVKDFHDFGNTIARLDKATKHSAIFAILSPISGEVIDIMPAVLPKLRRNVRIFRQLEKKKLFVTGNDLKRLGYKPGAKFRSILNRMRDWQFDRKIKNRKEALEYLRNIKH
jgi:tRNA nucleotidyltransferase (CCA-adding enzyme)